MATKWMVALAMGVTLIMLLIQIMAMYLGFSILLDTKLKGQEEKSLVFRGEIQPLPIVMMHGMGDAAGHSGMRAIQKAVAEKMGTYVASIQIGASVEEDVRNSFLLTMDDQLSVFAQKIKDDPKLANGFNAVGFSQGNLLIRGYIERHNDPPIRAFVSFHGPLAGVGALPQCAPTAFICKEVNRLIGNAVYNDQVQSHIAQANYFRDPLRIQEYLKHDKFLVDINNELPTTNATYANNFASLDKLVLVRAMKDTQVFPSESEWFGAYQDGSYDHVTSFNETPWYLYNSFGLKTLHLANKIEFLTTPGNHLQFSLDFLLKTLANAFVSLK